MKRYVACKYSRTNRSDKNRDDAAQVAITEAAKTIHGIRGIELTDLTGQKVEYRTCVNYRVVWNYDRKDESITSNIS